MRPVVTELLLSDRPDRWSALGFAVHDSRMRIGTVDVAFVAGAAGLVGWTLAGVATDSGDLDGVPTTVVDIEVLPAASRSPGPHPNGARSIDHVVLRTPDLDRTRDALADAGLDLRRTRDAGSPERPMTQAFYRLGEVVLEVVGSPIDRADGPSSLWGFVCTVDDLDAVSAAHADLVEPPRPAVQPCRRIATVGAGAGLAAPFAFMSE